MAISAQGRSSAWKAILALSVLAAIALILAFFFWPRSSEDPARLAAEGIAKDCAGGRTIENSSKVEAELGKYLTEASAGTKVTANDVGIVTSRLSQDAVGLEFYKEYTKCLTAGTENFLKLRGIAVVGQAAEPTLPEVGQTAQDGSGVLTGYIYYEENNGRATVDGVFEPVPRAPLVPYAQLVEGMILRAVGGAQIRNGPTGTDSPAEERLETGECVRVVGKPVHPPAVRLKRATSGGRIEVQAVACPSARKAQATTSPKSASFAQCVIKKRQSYEEPKEKEVVGGARVGGPGLEGGTRHASGKVCLSVGPEQELISANTKGVACHGGRCSVTEPVIDGHTVCVTARAWSASKSNGGGGSGQYKLIARYRDLAGVREMQDFEASCRHESQ